MREYSAKEVAFYCRMFKVPSVVTPGLDTKVSGHTKVKGHAGSGHQGQTTTPSLML